MSSHNLDWPGGLAPRGRIAYVNGHYVRHSEAAVHVEDRGLQLSDAVYEVFAVRGGALVDEEEHFDRLERSLSEIEMAMPIARNALRLVAREVVRQNRVRNGLLYLQVTRGAVHRDHPIPSKGPIPTLILTAHSLDPAPFENRAKNGIEVITCPDERWARRDIKTTQLLANLLARTAARRAGAYEAWLVEDGTVTEGAATSAFIVDGDGALVTRSLSHAILPGVTRRVILEASREAQVAIVERSFTLAEAFAAREAFISSATGIFPVTKIDGRTIGDGRRGRITSRIQELYALKTEARAKAQNQAL